MLIKENESILSVLYGADESARARIIKAVEEFTSLYGEKDYSVFTVSGRSEISGNHTDHNRGEVLAASVSLDIIAVAAPTDDGKIYVKSEGFSQNEVDLADLDPVAGEEGTSSALIRGVCDGFAKNNRSIGGFCAYMTSNVLGGSGLSSSAAFEDMIGNIENHLYNDGALDYIEVSQISRYAENVHFGKPCGLMDQMACAVGGFVYIDFENNSSPVVESVDFSLSGAGYSLCIVNTGGNHANLNADYASVPTEMKAVAESFGQPVIRGLSEADIIKKAPELREKVGDRAILRAIHFVRENARVEVARDALKSGELDRFFETILESGRSSFEYLQNVYTTINVREQGLSLALAITDGYLSGKGCAFRVHGGGFAGTIQAFVKNEYLDGYVALMNSVFGEGAAMPLNIRPIGAAKLF